MGGVLAGGRWETGGETTEEEEEFSLSGSLLEDRKFSPSLTWQQDEEALRLL